MVRLPALRSELQLLHARDEMLRELCEAYDDATQVLSGMRSTPFADRTMVADYEAVALGIESQVVELCAAAGRSIVR
jgi:hypothetical protein